MPRLTLFKKILITTLLLSLLPLITSSLILFFNLEQTSARLTSDIGSRSARQASESLQLRATQIAESVADFLHQCENDLVFLSRSRLDQAALANFYASRSGELWYRTKTATAPQEVREQVPLYRSIALIDKNGQEKLVIRNGLAVPASALKNVSDPRNTEFPGEEYFNRVRRHPGKIYVSRLTGFHLSKQEQLHGAAEPEDALDGKHYEGVIRFAAALFDNSGTFDGVVVISLDHRHLMEFTQHVDPGHNYLTLFPSYKSGNYAFMFDDEGWIITHPKYWDIRGFDRHGTLLSPYTAQSSQTDIATGRIPFNLDLAGFIHPNYPKVSEQVRKQKIGFVDITNVGGAQKIMAYAPIIYSSSDYAHHGVFGGITIGFQLDQFQDAARTGSKLVNEQLGEHRSRSAIILLITALLAGLAAWYLSRGITRALLQLTEGARRLADGDTASRVPVTTSDEIGELGLTFNIMADELENRKNNLLATLDELQQSRVNILAERNFKTSILESISSVITTISPAGKLTSINGVGQKLFADQAAMGVDYHTLFAAWPEVVKRIDVVLISKNGYGREPLRHTVASEIFFYDFGIFPIGSYAEMGLTVTLRNETERERLREETIRLDRLASLGKLSAGIAHEVRNPLTGISLLLDDMHDRPGFSSEEKELLAKALAEIERVERLISALLNYSAPIRTSFRDGDVNQLLRDILLLMRRQGEKQGVVFASQYGELPIFSFDPEKLRQALINILKNALEVLDQGGIITIATSLTDSSILIDIADNGPGIAEQDLPLIFEPFFTRKGAGTGLGLSITQRIIEEHGGTLTVASDAASGALFQITLPRFGHHHDTVTAA
jgi:signal transduction histidine kinase